MHQNPLLLPSRPRRAGRGRSPARGWGVGLACLLGAAVPAGCGGSGSDTSSSAPVVTGVSPTGGVTGGGAVVTITGSNLANATAVTFGGTAATSFAPNTGGTSFTAVAPPGTGTVDIVVGTIYGSSATSGADRFTYSNAVAITSVTPTSLGSGSAVTIAGTGFTNVQAVDFGSTAAVYTVTSPTSITATVPNLGTTAVSETITVTTSAGTSNQEPWFYNPNP